jgi:glycosyl transferase family 25
MVLTLKQIPIYVVHYKKATHRKEYLTNWSNKNNLQLHWVEDPQREDLTEELINTYYSENLIQPEWSKYPTLNRRLSLGEIACGISHLKVYQDCLEKNYDHIIILEDDCQFPNNFIELFDTLFKNCPDDYDIISLGSCLNLRHEHANDKQQFLKKIPPVGRCGYSQVLSKSACKKIIERSIPFNYPIDWQVYVLSSDHKTDPLNMYWIEPPLTIDGGTTSSTM